MWCSSIWDRPRRARWDSSQDETETEGRGRFARKRAAKDAPRQRSLRPLRMVWQAGTGYPGHVALALVALFITAAALIQASHSVYCGFGTLNWKAQGYSETVIGFLWAEGVIAEIILFAFGAHLVRRLGPAKLILLGGVAGAVRWSVTGTAGGLGVLIIMQALHAFTFAATHLGAIYFISRRVPQAVSASAQSLYSAVVMGLALGLAMLASGNLYSLYGAGAYQAMAVMAALGSIVAVFILRRRATE